MLYLLNFQKEDISACSPDCLDVGLIVDGVFDKHGQFLIKRTENMADITRQKVPPQMRGCVLEGLYQLFRECNHFR